MTLFSRLGEPICVCGEAKNEHTGGECPRDQGTFRQDAEPRPSDAILRAPGHSSGWGINCHWSGCSFRTPEFTRTWPAREAIVEHIKAVHLSPPDEPCATKESR